MDPPFGGRAEFLAESVKKCWEMAGKGTIGRWGGGGGAHTSTFSYFLEVSTFLVFPYFLESHVVTAMPSLWMMDYQVNHVEICHNVYVLLSLCGILQF